MIAALVSLSIRWRGVVILATVIGALLGARAYQTLSIDAVPDLTNVQVQILSNAPGLAPLETENLIARPVELAMAGIPGVEGIRSLSRAGVAAVTVIFHDGVSLDSARQLVDQRLPAARASVPRFASPPEMGPPSTGLGEVYHFTMRWPGHSLRDVRTVLDWDVAIALKLVPGVVEVNAWGGEKREVEVRLRQADLQALNISPQDVEACLTAGGVTLGGGALPHGDEQVQVRLDGTYRSIQDVGAQVVKTREHAPPILVRDVATVRDGSRFRQSAATADGEGEVVYAMAQMVAGGNAHEVVAAIKARMAILQATLPDGLVISTVYDRTAFVDRVLSTVRLSLLEGGLVVALVLFLFLGELRAGLVVASAIPLAMLGAFGCMKVAGLSGNLMSLGAIDFGLVVDGSVVMVEGALAAMAAQKLTADRALEHYAVTKGRPLALAMVVLAVVYIPVLLLEGVEGKLFRPMALTVLFALGTALVLSFTWIPAIASLVLKHHGDSEPRIVSWLRRGHDRALAFALHRPALAATTAVALVVLGVVAAARRGAEFIPRLDEGDLVVTVTRPGSLSLAEAVRGTSDVEAALKHFPEVRSVVSRTGSPDVATDIMGIEQSDVFVLLKPRDEWTSAHDFDALAEVFSKALTDALPGSTFGVTQPIEMRTAELLGGVKSDVGIMIVGDDLVTLRNLEAEVVKLLHATPGAEDVRGEALEGLSLLSVRIDPERAGRVGVTPDEVAFAVELLRQGRPVGIIREGERRFDVVLRADAPPSPDEESFRNSMLIVHGGRAVPLGEVATLDVSDVPPVVGREQSRRRVLVECNVRDRDLAGFVAELQLGLARLEKPKTFSFALRGQYDHLVSAAKRLGLVIPLVLFALFALLYVTFGELRPTLLVLTNLPVAASGGLMALAICGLPLSISAAIGLIALFGVVTLNGVVLLSGILDRVRVGEDLEDAVRDGTRDRFRPVLTTAFVAALGFLPMALSSGAGAEVQRPLATVVIGGLVTATLLTLVLAPAFALFGLRKAQPRATTGDKAANGLEIA